MYLIEIPFLLLFIASIPLNEISLSIPLPPMTSWTVRPPYKSTTKRKKTKCYEQDKTRKNKKSELEDKTSWSRCIYREMILHFISFLLLVALHITMRYHDHDHELTDIICDMYLFESDITYHKKLRNNKKFKKVLFFFLIFQTPLFFHLLSFIFHLRLYLPSIHQVRRISFHLASLTSSSKRKKLKNETLFSSSPPSPSSPPKKKTNEMRWWDFVSYLRCVSRDLIN